MVFKQEHKQKPSRLQIGDTFTPRNLQQDLLNGPPTLSI